MLPIMRTMTILGIPRLMMSFDKLPSLLAEQETKVPESIRPMLRAGWLRTGSVTTLADEGSALIETLEQVRRTDSLGDLPLVVVTATAPVWWPDMPGQVNPVKFRKMWLDLQQDLTTLSSNSRQVFADQSGHFIQFDQPSLVIEVIRQMVNNTRQPSRSR